MQPSVIINELDGQLGVVPSSGGRLLAIIGCSSMGPLNLPSSFATISDIENTFGTGRMPEAAAIAIGQGKRVLLVRAAAAAADFGTYSAAYSIVKDAASTSTLAVVPPDATNGPMD